MNSVSKDIKDILVQEGFGVYASTSPQGWGIFVSQEPADPARTITVYDGEPEYGKSHNTDTIFEKAPIQVRVRAPEFDEAYEMLRDIMRKFKNYGSWRAGAVAYKNILWGFGPIDLKRDSKQRSRWVMNFMVVREYNGKTA